MRGGAGNEDRKKRKGEIVILGEEAKEALVRAMRDGIS